jgi:hypothetical protein
MPLAFPPTGVFDLKQFTAEDAAEVGLSLGAGDPSPASDTTQLVQIVVHVWC